MWTWEDAWILQSVAQGSGLRGRDLAHVIGAADAINVDIPSRETLERSVNRLIAAGLISAKGGRLRGTRAGRRLVRGAGNWRQGIREMPRLIEARLRQVPFSGDSTQWRLSESDWTKAYGGYGSAVNSA